MLLALASAVFANGLLADFQFDDFQDIVDNRMATFEGLLAAPRHTVRPLLKFSYALNGALAGIQPLAFHLTNVALHLGSVLLVFLLIRRAAGLLQIEETGAERVAFAATAVWAVHPALTETVTYVSGRSSGLSSLLMLAALLLATGDMANKKRRRMLAAGLCALLAPLARETALILPALLLWWQLTLGPREPWRDMALRQAPVLAGTAVAAAIILSMPHHVELVSYSLRNRPLADTLRGNLYAVYEILSYLIRPWAVSIDPAAPRAEGWTDAPSLLRLAGLAGAALFALTMRRRYPLAAFCVGWTLLCLAPTNSVIWRSDPVGLKPLYMASLGPAIAIALVMVGLYTRKGVIGIPMGKIVMVVLVAGLAVSTVQRNMLFASHVELWRDAVAKAPDKGRPHLNLGLAYLDAGRPGEADAEFARAFQLEPWLAGSKQGQKAARRIRDSASEGN
jgi:hypothetical protein